LKYLSAALFSAVGTRLQAQCSAPASVPFDIVSVGSPADERFRDDQLRGRCSTSGALIRSASSLSRDVELPGDVRWVGVLPRIENTINSELPVPLNDGPQWAGRGWTTALSGGVRLETDRLSVGIMPQVVYTRNLPFFVFQSLDTSRSVFASPWHGSIESADLPLRFGDRPITQIFPGDSWVEARVGDVGIGASTENLWWGPGLRNALLMSNNAAGIPQIYLRTRKPIRTVVGDVETRVFLGVLTESRFFDDNSKNDYRAFSAAVATLRVPFDTGLTLGLARSVYTAVERPGAVLPHVVDFAVRWDQVADTLSPVPKSATDQLLSFFGRWISPVAGIEIYGEWAKLFAPGIRELLVSPDAHQGFTVGLQWESPIIRFGALRLQAEATTLEQNPPTPGATTPIFYASRFNRQGYTQRGQVIGAAIGPGASSQWLAFDFLGPVWRYGAFVGRTRVEDEALYQQPDFHYFQHDVTVYSGVRGGARFPRVDVSGELFVGRRYNYLFQNNGDIAKAMDIQNITLRFRVTP